MSAKVIAIANQKGGVAKTTTTFNIASAIASRGYNVLMIDMDSQASLTISAGLEPLEYEEGNICDVLDPPSEPISINDCITELDHIKNLSIIPSMISLSVVEMKILLKPLPKGERNRLHAGAVILSKALAEIKEVYDFIFIDCPPQLSILTLNALAAANEVIAPVKTDYLARRGLEDLIETVESAVENLNSNLKLRGIIATMYEKAITADREILELLENETNVIGVIRKAAAIKNGVTGGYPAVMLPEYRNNDAVKEYNRIAELIIKEKEMVKSNGN